MFKEAVSQTFTLLAVWVVVSLGWYLAADRSAPRGAKQLAWAEIIFYVGLLVTQVYSLLQAQWVLDGGGGPTDLSPYWPLATVGIVMAFSGVAWKVWLFKPYAPLWLWLGVIAASGLTVLALRVVIF